MRRERGGRRLEDRKAQKKADATPAAARTEPAAPKAPAKKLSYKQQFALENLPRKIEAVTVSIARLEDAIADPAYYERDPSGFQKTIAALDKERVTLAALEEEWLELEMLREELEG
jgi:ATP-binding cassette subfamily F protein uup